MPPLPLGIGETVTEMCGLAGFLDVSRSRGREEMSARVTAMANALVHRGPDDEGSWVDAQAGVALGHRRLSILDLSPLGHQPMESPCGRYVAAFNGEIYNFLELRQDLAREGHAFRGHSDTEVMLTAVSAWGLHEVLRRLNGMFAIALWDRHTRTLYLARDRLGEKPLYYGWVGATLLFASELKGLRAFPGFQPAVERNVLALFLRYGYVPAPYSIYQGVLKLLPAHVLGVRADGGSGNGAPIPYWSARHAAETGVSGGVVGRAKESLGELDGLLRDAVRQRMVADVPIGAFLSGGVDSSIVVALMQAQSSQAVRTFTIGFTEPAFNEADHASAVAAHLGTEHTELYVTPQEAMAVIPQLPSVYDEPFSDSSQIPTLLVCRLARRHVTVALSGDGGDELFGGYARYLIGTRLGRLIRWLPPQVRREAARRITAVPPNLWEDRLRLFAFLAPRNLRFAQVGDKLHKLAQLLMVDQPEGIYLALLSHWSDATAMVPGAREVASSHDDPLCQADLREPAQRMMFLDMITYLPDDILVKVDRASMFVGLEARVPLLDHRVVEHAWRVPVNLKLRARQGKWLLRQLLYRYVPRDLVERPKMGFAVPLDAWLRGPLRSWAEDLLDEGRLRREGYLDPVVVRRKWSEHLSKTRNWHYPLWDVLMFQSWLDRWGR